MKNKRRYRTDILVCAVLLAILTTVSSGQSSVSSEPGAILDRIEEGIVAGNVKYFSSYLGSQIAITMGSDQTGSYSANQGFSILKNFFELRKTLSFAFTTQQESAQRAFATGGGRFLRRGMKENLQVYVVLDRIEGKWIITQISLY